MLVGSPIGSFIPIATSEHGLTLGLLVCNLTHDTVKDLLMSGSVQEHV